jgi:hypothetical protein
MKAPRPAHRKRRAAPVFGVGCRHFARLARERGTRRSRDPALLADFRERKGAMRAASAEPAEPM